jgi:hypothetical protein
MAHLDTVSDNLRKAVAREIGKFLDTGKTEPPPPGEAAPLEIAETVTVWKLQPKAFKELGEKGLGGDLHNWVEPAPFLYHQIRLRGKVTGFARSYVEERIGAKTVLQVSASPIASRVHKLFEKIDSNESHEPFLAFDPVVRLLQIPPFQISALWLFSEERKESRVVIVRAPKRFTEMHEGTFLTSEQFFAALKKGGPQSGVI